jgi:transcription factor IIIB subunit 2
MSRKSGPCKACGAIGSVVEDSSNGYRVCSACGAIISESILVNEVDFTEMANGTSSRNGQFVVAPSHKQNYSTSTHSSIAGSHQIQSICDQLPRLENFQEVCELAQRLFKTALQNRFIRGRTIEIVAAACVYLAIRKKKITGYLLVDVADHIDCGIFELAATALRLCAAMKDYLPVIDPTLYVDRFTDELKFGRLAPDIKQSAIQIIRRLDRDWIQTGRKPAGVCGAAIILAAKIHHIDVTGETIRKCARVCMATINKRLREIGRTQLARASISEMRANQDVFREESRELPPAMLVRKKLAEVAAEIEAQETEESDSDGQLDDDFSDDDLADVDALVLSEEEMEKRSALFYTMYKSKLNQPPKEPKPKKPSKKAAAVGRIADPDDGPMVFVDRDDAAPADDALPSDGGDFEDLDLD